MSLSIPAHMNPICAAMRDFVQTDYLLLDNKQRGSECKGIRECHCSSMQGINLCIGIEAGKQHLSLTYKVNCFLVGHAGIFAPQLTKILLNPEQKHFC